MADMFTLDMVTKKNVQVFSQHYALSSTSWNFRSVHNNNQQVKINIFLGLKKIRQGKLTFYVLRRKNYMYICWTKVHFNELSIYSSIEFLHYQLTSSLT